MKLLFITESFYYNPSPNGNCVMKIAQCLIDRGHEVSVLALENQLVNETESVGQSRSIVLKHMQSGSSCIRKAYQSFWHEYFNVLLGLGRDC